MNILGLISQLIGIKTLRLTHRIHSLDVSNQKYDPHINRRRFPKKISKWNRTPKGSSNFG